MHIKAETKIYLLKSLELLLLTIVFLLIAGVLFANDNKQDTPSNMEIYEHNSILKTNFISNNYSKQTEIQSLNMVQFQIKEDKSTEHIIIPLGLNAHRVYLPEKKQLNY